MESVVSSSFGCPDTDMTASTARDLTTVALIGNPNTGKSTLFGALVGVRQAVGNYPGVTVERRSGQLEYAGRKIEMIDPAGALQSCTAQPRRNGGRRRSLGPP